MIGTNLNGLKKFIDKAWQEKAETMTLKKTDGTWDTASALATMKESAWNFRQPVEQEQIVVQLHAMVENVIQEMVNDGEQAPSVDVSAIAANSDLSQLLEDTGIAESYIDEMVKQQHWLNRAYAEYEELCKTIEDAPPEIADTVDQAYRVMLGRWFSRKFFAVPDAEASGEQVVSRIVQEIPPGYLARTMGLQNIKGTGLDFVYRFHAWDTCFEACEATQDRRLQVAEKAIAALVAMPVIGQLCVKKLTETIRLCRTNKLLQRSDLQSQLDILENRVDAVSGKTESATTGAELIYREYVACRISRQRAVVELRKLNKRQKGGWLKEDSKKVRNKLLLKTG